MRGSFYGQMDLEFLFNSYSEVKQKLLYCIGSHFKIEVIDLSLCHSYYKEKLFSSMKFHAALVGVIHYRAVSKTLLHSESNVMDR